MNIGFAMCGSFCTFSKVFPVMEILAKKHTLIPIYSPVSYSTGTRFGTAQEHIRRATEICGKEPLHTIEQVEPIGPKKLLDALIIAPCTGNTLAKLHHGITDTAVLMAIKAQVRNDRPVVLALSTNDALGTSAVNIGGLLNRRNLYFVPFSQDDHDKKPRSMAARFGLCEQTMEAALEGRQAQPLIL